jgi:hypothetical protein
MSHIPNKPTLIAAALYGASAQVDAGERKLAWNELSDAQRKPFITASEFLGGQMIGAQIQHADRDKLAAGLEGLKLEALDLDGDGNSETLVSIFISVASALPSA